MMQSPFLHNFLNKQDKPISINEILNLNQRIYHLILIKPPTLLIFKINKKKNIKNINLEYSISRSTRKI